MPPTRRRSTASSLFAPPGTQSRQAPYLPLVRRTGEGRYYTGFGPTTQPLIESAYVSPLTQRSYAPAFQRAAAQAASSPFTGPYEPVGGAGYPYGYTRNLQRAARPAAAPAGQGYPYGYTRPGFRPEPGWMPTAPGTAGGGAAPGAGGAAPGAGGGVGRAPGATAPPGLGGWYQEFAAQHGGQTPEEFYEGVGRYGEGLAEALADRDWGRGFEQMTGRPPTEDEWRAHYLSSRPGAEWGAMSRAERKEARQRGRKRASKEWARRMGWGRPEAHDQAVAEGWAVPGMSRMDAELYKIRIEAGLAEPTEGSALAKQKAEETEERAPLYKPPQVSWR